MSEQEYREWCKYVGLPVEGGEKRIAQVCKQSWAGFLAYDVEVIGETTQRYRVKALQPFTLPSRRHLAVGDVALVPKTAVRFLEPERATQPCRRDRDGYCWECQAGPIDRCPASH